MESAATVAVVTGAARGFGREIARRLVGRGHRVVITDLDADALAAAAAELGATGIVADARIAADHQRVAAEAAALGAVGVWVNNAGVLRAGKVWEQSDDDIALMVDANLLGVIHGSRAAIEVMRGGVLRGGGGVLRGGGGHLLNIASMSAHGPVPGLAVYAATKSAVLNFTTSLQGDLDLDGVPIRVHALCPDPADTDMVRGGHRDTAILFAQRTLLTPAAVADAAVELLDGRRIVASLPGHRAALARIGAVLPRIGLPVLARMRAQGERRRAQG